MTICSVCQAGFSGAPSFCEHCSSKLPPPPASKVAELLCDDLMMPEATDEPGQSIMSAFSVLSECDDKSHVVMASFDKERIRRGLLSPEKLPQFCRKCGAPLPKV